MKKRILLAFLLTAACQSNTPTETTPAAPSLAASMQNFKNLITELLPVVVDKAQFNLASNKEKIDHDVQQLVEVSRQVVHNPATEKMDPSLRFISTAFSEDLRRAKESLDLGQREFARYTLINVTAYCIECHTRTSSGPSFRTPQLDKAMSGLQPMERGEFLLATREFDHAYSEFESVIRKLLSQEGNLFDLEKAMRDALSISVKFQNDPKKSKEIVDLVMSSDRAPYYLKQNAHSWSQAIKSWSKEKSLKSNSPTEILKHADRLVKQAKAAQAGLSDRGGDIDFFRALSELNALLGRTLSADDLGHALYLTGTCYEAVRDQSIWSLHENYFESCIRQVPHGVWADKCYTRLEESIYLGYSGTSGVSLPNDVKVKLEQLQKLALPETVKSQH